MITLADIKKDLPAWPDDVIEQWLLHLARRDDTGWPPPEPLEDHPWTYILGHRPLSWWKKVTWKLENKNCSPGKLCRSTQRIVNQMIADVTGGKADQVTKKRWDSAFNYILNNATFRKPLIVMELADGLSVLDGNHRVGAFCGLQKMPEESFAKLGLKKPAEEQNVWVGTHSDGEVPLD